MLTTAKPATIVITATVITSCRVLNPRALLKAVLFIIWWSAPFLISNARLHKDGRCYVAMTMPALFTWFLLGIYPPVPRDGTSGVTLGDSEWKCASYLVQGLRSKVQRPDTQPERETMPVGLGASAWVADFGH